MKGGENLACWRDRLNKRQIYKWFVCAWNNDGIEALVSWAWANTRVDYLPSGLWLYTQAQYLHDAWSLRCYNARTHQDRNINVEKTRVSVRRSKNYSSSCLFLPRVQTTTRDCCRSIFFSSTTSIFRSLSLASFARILLLDVYLFLFHPKRPSTNKQSRHKLW